MAILVKPPLLALGGCRRCLLYAAFVGVGTWMASPAAAQVAAPIRASDVPRNVVGGVVGGDITYDSNLFRQPSTVARTSDTISTAYLGLRIDKQISLQRFQLDITETIRRYENSKQLNFDSLDYRGAWLWQVGSRVSGTLSADRKESLVPFEDSLNLGNTSRNVRVNENRAFTLDAWLAADWHLLLGVNQTTQKSEQALQIQPDFKATGREAGIKYTPSSGSSISVIRRSISGDYTNQGGVALFGSGYHQDESELTVNWIASGKSTLNGRLTWLDRTQEGAGQRNFSGLSSEILYAWTPTGKLSMNLVARRDLVPFQDLSGSYIINNTLSIAPTWSITAKTVAHLVAARTTSEFAGTAIGPAIGQSRKDTLNFVEMGVDWNPVSRLIFSVSLLHQTRDSNVAGYAFKDTIARISGSYRF